MRTWPPRHLSATVDPAQSGLSEATVAKAEKAVAEKLPVKCNRFIKLTGWPLTAGDSTGTAVDRGFASAGLPRPMLRVDPAQHRRLVEIISNVRDRITEAKTNGWLGEVQGLQTSLDAATRKLAGLDRTLATRRFTQQADLGIPRPPVREEP